MTALRLARGALGVLANLAAECIRPRRRYPCLWAGAGCFTTHDPVLRDAHHFTHHAGDTPRTKGYAR